MKNDLKPLVAETYLIIIKGTLNRILLGEIDSILNDSIRMYVQVPGDKPADEVLLITDKFNIYRSLWKAILETLYEKYLPHIKYEFKWEVEITPYTLMMCEFTKDISESNEIELLKAQMSISDEEIETEFESILEKAELGKIGLPEGIKNRIPIEHLPDLKKDQLILLFRLMNFPPLSELSRFQLTYNSMLQDQATSLSVAFSGIDPERIPSFGMPEPLHCSYFHIYHETFKKHGLSGFENHPSLSGYKSEFTKIRELADKNKSKFKGEIICPCCGEKQDVEVPEEFVQYKYLLEKQSLAIKVGLIYLNEFTETYLQKLADRYYSYIPNINKVDNPDCLILVEGESEEASIPLLAFRMSFTLAKRNIQVYNSKSKSKLYADFMNFKTNYPKRKIICLLDSDAKKEKSDIERIIANDKHKYRLVFIEKGTFEDIFDLDFSIKILNELYPEGDEIIASDFDNSKDFLSNIKRIMYEKKKAQFDKVLFAKTVSTQIDIAKLPKEIAAILEIADDFTKPKSIFKQK